MFLASFEAAKFANLAYAISLNLSRTDGDASRSQTCKCCLKIVFLYNPYAEACKCHERPPAPVSRTWDV